MLQRQRLLPPIASFGLAPRENSRLEELQLTGGLDASKKRAVCNREGLRIVPGSSAFGLQPPLGSGPCEKFREPRHNLHRRRSGKGSLLAPQWPRENNK